MNHEIAVRLLFTLAVIFALAGLGADTLTQLGSMTTEFCIYKTLRARLLG